MSNGASTPIDFNQTLSSFLATAVSDGTWADVTDALKVDDVAAAATDITANAGQLWGNVMDDMFKATWDQFFSARKLWAFADGTARDNTGSDAGVAVNDLCNLDGTDQLFYCDSVAASTSTWVQFAGGGEVNTSSNSGSGEGLALPKSGVDLPFKSLVAGTGISISPSPDTLQIDASPLSVVEANWVAGAGSQVEALAIGEVLYAIPAGGETSRPLQVELADSGSPGERCAFQFFGTPDSQPIDITTPGGVTSVEGPNSTGTTVSLLSPGEIYDTALLTWEWQVILGSGLWKLVEYHEAPFVPATGEINTSSNLGAGEGLAAPKVGADLPFKSLVAGDGVALSASADEVEISSPVPPLVLPNALVFGLISTTFGVDALANTIGLANAVSPGTSPGDPAVFPVVSFGALASTLEAGADIVVRAPFPASPGSTLAVTLGSKAPGPDPAFTIFTLNITATYGQVGVIDSVAVFCRNPISGRETFAGWVSTVLNV